MRHQTLLFGLLITGLLGHPAPVLSQYDDFTLPPGVEDTVIPKRLRQHNMLPHPNQSASDVRQMDSYRASIEKYYQQKDYASAEPLYSQYVALLEKLAPDSPPLAEALHNYAELLRKLQKEEPAQAAQARAEAISSHVENLAKPYGLKEYRLGMSLDDFSKLVASAPESEKVKGICSCDAGQTVEVLADADRAAGVIQCGLWHKEKDATAAVTSPHTVTVAGIECTPDFRFIEKDGIYRLFEISASYYSSNYDQLKRALALKYGEPQGRKITKLRTDMGNNFQLTNLIWDNGLSKIKLNNADGTSLGRARLRYVHTLLSADFAKRINDSKQSPAKQAADDL